MSKAVVKLSQLKKVAGLQCTQLEAACFLGIRLHEFKKLLRTNVRVAQVWQEGQQLGRVSLRRDQRRLGRVNPSMAIHLGKVYLDQNLAAKHEHTGEDGGPIETYDVSKMTRAERDQLRRLLDRARKPDEA